MTEHLHNGETHTHNHTAGIVFHEEEMPHEARHRRHHGTHHAHTSHLAHALVTHSGGLIKNNTQASHVLLVLAVCGFIFSAFFFWQANTVSETTEVKIVAPEGSTLINSAYAPPRIRN